ncbi:hypothetical protein CJ030_MR8G018178 [Morella rubra]|uniref:Polygalacturonase n=1 Tax=Morella rubra TaxID=262757 RepID=A0A6A1UNU3_9ROSI|nr:hypothetical protein CJ030_MR8G018178 [Morella rubra]
MGLICQSPALSLWLMESITIKESPSKKKLPVGIRNASWTATNAALASPTRGPQGGSLFVRTKRIVPSWSLQTTAANAKELRMATSKFSFHIPRGGGFQTGIVGRGEVPRSTKQEHLHAVTRISKPYSSGHLAVNSSKRGSSKSSPQVFNVVSFGAVGHGITDDSEAFKKAWSAACQAKKPALLLVPSKRSLMIQAEIFTGPCQSRLIIQIDGTLMAPDGPKSWKSKTIKQGWLHFKGISGMTLQGRGLIDGRGERWWNHHSRPDKALSFHLCTDLTIRGLKIKSSPKFHVVFHVCQNVLVDWLSIKAPADSPNTDGIHFEETKNVRIYNSVISTGDDCISIGTASHQVEIRNVTCGPSHGISYPYTLPSAVIVRFREATSLDNMDQFVKNLLAFGLINGQNLGHKILSPLVYPMTESFCPCSIGSLGRDKSRACVSDITVSDSIIKNSTNGARIKTWQGGSGAVSRVTFRNIMMDRVLNPIIITQYYCLNKHCPNQTSALSIFDVSYINIHGTYDVRSPPIHLACSDSMPCRNITLSGVRLRPAQGKTHSNPFCWKAYGITQTSSLPPVPCLLKGLPEKPSRYYGDAKYQC